MLSTKELGKLKLEHKVKKGIFITNKTYCLVYYNDKFINKAKGIKSNSLSITDYEKLLSNENVTTAIKVQSKTDWMKGEVRIYDKENITINSNSYTKREKIYMNNKWLDTKPNVLNITKGKSYHTSVSRKRVYLNYFDLNLVTYKPVVLDLVVYKAHNLDMVLFKKFINNSWTWDSQNTNLKRNVSIKEYIFLSIALGLYVFSFLFKQDPLVNNEIFIGEIEPSELELEEDLEYKSVKDSSILEIKSYTFEESSSISRWEDSINNEKEKQLLSDEELKLDCPENKDKTLYENFLNRDLDKEISIPNTLINTEVNIPCPSHASHASHENKLPFSPFTPNTLEELNSEIYKTGQAVKDITNKIDNGELATQDKRKLSVLLEEQQYFIDQHKNHLESLNNKDLESFKNVEDKIQIASKIENQVKELKENLNQYKEKLNQDIDKYRTRDNLEDDSLDSTRKVSDNKWKENLSPEEINAVESIDDKAVRDIVKNRIDL